MQMIDIHCHILPQIDDGAKTLEDSIFMVKKAIIDGIDTIIATPHSQDGLFSPDINDVINKTLELNNINKSHNLNINIIPGMEVHLCKNIFEKIKSKQVLTLNDSNYLLLELPGQHMPDFIFEEIFQLRLNGITPIIAHPERNMVIIKDWTLLYGFVEKGVLIQITSGSISGKFGHEIFKCSKKIIKNRLAHIIASDAHNSESRPPVLLEAFTIAKKILGSDKEAYEMVYERPKKIINNKTIEIPDPFKKRKKNFFKNFVRR